MITINKEEKKVTMSTVSEIVESTNTLDGTPVYNVEIKTIACTDKEDAEAIKDKIDGFLTILARNLWD